MAPVTDGSRNLDDLVWLRRVRDRIDREYAQPLDVEALARGAHMSAGHLSREFKRAFGESPYSYLMTRRIERATALLRETDLAITEVALQTGWNSIGTFGRIFRDITGESPGEFRLRERPAANALEQAPECIARAIRRPALDSAVSEKRRREAVATKSPRPKEAP